MRNRTGIRLWIALAGFLAGWSAWGRESSPRAVILLSIDTMSADHMSAYGYSRETTPFLSKFARESVLLENLYSQGAYSLPSHYSLFTGTYAETHQITDVWTGGNVLDPRFKTLTQCLKAHGYRTIWAGTPSHPQLDMSRGLGRGFDEVHPLDWATWKQHMAELKGILRKNKDRKFFMFLHTNMDHDPYHPVPPYDHAFDPGFGRHVVVTMSELVALLPPRPGESEYLHAQRIRKKYLSQFDLTNPADKTHFEALYDGAIRSGDDILKDLFGYLKELGLYDRALLILTSDHGEAFGDHGHFFHSEPYREEIHVAGMMRVPGLPPRRISEPVMTIDVMPTILDLLGIAPPPQVEGTSLVRLFRGNSISRKGFFFSHGLTSTAVWDREWKLIRSRSGAKSPELYHLTDDPWEGKDVASEHPDVVSKMGSALESFLIRRSSTRN